MSFGIPELAIIAVIVLVLFGTSKLRNVGSDLGSAIKGFKSAVSEDDKPAELEADEPSTMTQKTDEAVTKVGETKNES